MAREMSIAVCVITFRRPLWLSGLLESVRSLDEPLAARIFAVVVDNDPAGSAREVAEHAGARAPFRVLYDIETRRGISFARNHAVTRALAEGADFVAFVDDDEVVSPKWLHELIEVQHAHSADVVSGPVVPRFDQGVPQWIARGGFFDRPRFATGTVRAGGATNNCLIARQVFADWPEPFDPRFATSGGGDMHFFRQVALRGGRIVWADQAVVEEWVPRSRASVRWLLQRAYRGGNAYTMSEGILDGSLSWKASRLIKGLGRALQGSFLLLPSVLLGRAGMLRSLQKAALGAGTLVGLMGYRYEEYRAVHGR